MTAVYVQTTIGTHNHQGRPVVKRAAHAGEALTRAPAAMANQ